MRPRRARCDISDQRDREESAEPVEANEPIEQIDRNEPADPIERIDPADPIDKIDPFEPIDNSESSDQGDQRDRARTINRVCTGDRRQRVVWRPKSWLGMAISNRLYEWRWTISHRSRMMLRCTPKRHG